LLPFIPDVLVSFYDTLLTARLLLKKKLMTFAIAIWLRVVLTKRNPEPGGRTPVSNNRLTMRAFTFGGAPHSAVARYWTGNSTAAHLLMYSDNKMVAINKNKDENKT
jgi:hypothetical protein